MSQAHGMQALRRAERDERADVPRVRAADEYGPRHDFDDVELEPASASTVCDESDPEAQLRAAMSYDKQAANAKGGKTPLNWFQLGTLCAVRIVEPIAFTQIFPYVNDMMASFRLTDDPSKVGFYSGMVESIFAIAQLLSIYQWARLSDRIGRRPVLLIGTTGLAITTMLFGLSSTLTETLGARFLSGLCSGNVAVMHSVLGELTDSSNQAVAFPIYGLVWPVGAILGPLLGGTLSRPAENFPALFDTALFRRFPFFLPCLIAGVTALGGCVLGWLWLDETLPSRVKTNRRAQDVEHIPLSSKEGSQHHDLHSAHADLDERGAEHQLSHREYPPHRSRSSSSSETLYDPNDQDGQPSSPKNKSRSPAVSNGHAMHGRGSDQKVTMRSLLSIAIIRALCLSGMALAFLNTGFDVVFVLFCYSPVRLGGLGLDPSQIGYILSLSGVCSIAIQIFIMPTLLRKFDLVRMYGVCMAIWPAAFALMPGLNVLARVDGNPFTFGSVSLAGDVLGTNGGGANGTLLAAREIAHTALEASGAVHEGVAGDSGAAALGPLVWLGIALILFLARSACIAYSLSMILVKENAPSPAALGTTNGLAQATMCFARAFSPAFVSSLYAISVDTGLLGGYAWVTVMVVISVCASRITRTIERETKRVGRGHAEHGAEALVGFE
ncbi:MFS general substrate transporter [Punctularia strigosozonata HHB-11173 SS5]|uniref:MFS general substrate transporter n=1 Tax=Punctularia strigosozonata (strain HHB-11173) TaxID=741275 RepID=UPI0004416D59|nr:MFS general substrate transporter [Punctularia strigosozonata HHB-11173 SS5]EIN06786.1 MFS general substrate transporter [Punctularia strigosozonata HHB-11173 SS5]